jgi:GNAT superfamily N-acetyltransferase
MTTRGDLKPRDASDPRFEIREATVPQWQVNRFLYSYVGEPWGWSDKRVWPDERWQRYVDMDLRTWLSLYDGSIAGYFELHRANGEVEISYFGLTPEFIGRGYGGVLLTRALEEAWNWNATRVWVHTCTLDHPAALRNYEARGMRVYKVVTEQRAG